MHVRGAAAAWVVWAGVVGALAALPGTVWAQSAAVTVAVEPGDVGVAGLAAPGRWTPLRATLRNRTADYREVKLQWSMPDADGDTVRYERRVALNPGAEASAWVYGVWPSSSARRTSHPLSVIDAGPGGALLHRVRVAPPETTEVDRPVIGVFGGSELGLGFAERRATRHEPVRVHAGLELSRMPDRWHGLQMFKALVWAPPGGSPTGPDVDPASLRAIAQWVRRGGHLVLLWPATGQTWSDTPIAELLPFEAEAAVRVTREAPAWLGQPLPGSGRPIGYHVFRLDPASGAAVIRSDADAGRPAEGRPVIVARRHGMGRVTVVGVDWSQPAMRAMDLPNGRYTPWHAIFGWQSPAYRESVVEAQIANQTMVNPRMQTPRALGRGFLARTAMRETAGPVLLAAVVVFLLYWLIAGPVADTVLSKRGLGRKRWVVFAGATIVFAGVSWGGAYLARPGAVSVSHVTVLDVDAATGRAKATSLATAYVPRFGRSELAVAPGLERELNDNLLSTAGIDRTDAAAVAFLDTQIYALDAAHPFAAAVPMRSTSRAVRLDYEGPLLAASEVEPLPRGVEWSVPRGELTLDPARWPRGELRHGLPGALRDVRVFYCPGDGETPWVWRIAERWPPDTPLTVAQPGRADRLVVPPPGRSYGGERRFKGEGFLGKRLATRAGAGDVELAGGAQGGADATMIEQMELLSFFDMLPPPHFRNRRAIPRYTVLRRPLGASLDLSHLTATRCVILIGHLPDAPLPAPLTVARSEPPSRGWTTVRVIFDLK